MAGFLKHIRSGSNTYKRRCVDFVFVLPLWFCTQVAVGDADEDVMVITHTEVTDYLQYPDSRYEVPLIVLAMEKTREEYGDFKLNPLDTQMTLSREMEQMVANAYPNFIQSHGFERNMDPALTYIEFPIYLGLLSYRTCFTSASKLDALSRVNNIDDLRLFSQGSGIGWTDTTVLRHNDINVVEVANEFSLIKMTAKGRIDLFCRGGSEILSEYERYDFVKGLEYDRSIAMYYPMPIFLYTNVENKRLVERMRLGIRRAYEDGSLRKLWEHNFKRGFEFQQLPSRTILNLQNPLTDAIPFDYEKYFYRGD